MHGETLGKSLTGQVALVTGGTRGIGRGTVEELAERGARVFIGSRSLERGQELATALCARGLAVEPLEIDVLDERSISTAFAVLNERCGGVSVLVNNVGTTAYQPFAEITAETWDWVMATNVRSAFLCSQQAIGKMLTKGHGQIVNVGSIWATRGGPGRAAYIASKHALIGLTRALDQEFRSRGICVNMVNPGPVATERALATDVDTSEWLEPRDIGSVIAYLLSPDAKAIRGAVVDALGQGKVLSNFD